MTYEERQEENRREYNRWLDQQQYRRRDEEWDRKRLEANQVQAARHFREGKPYVAIYQLAGPAAANAYAERMRENQANMAAYYVNLAHAEMDGGDYIRAIDDLNKALNLEPLKQALYFDRGICYDKLGKYREAEHDYSQAIELCPNSCFPYLARGECRWKLRDYDGAIKDLDLAESLLPHQPWESFPPEITRSNELAEICYWRGCARYFKGDFKTASVDFNISIQSRPNWPDPYLMRAASFQELKLDALAIDDLTVVLKVNPTASIFRDRARSYRAVGNYLAALGDMNKVIQLNPTPDDYLWRGWTYLNMGGHDDEAISDFDTAIKFGHEDAFVYLGRAHAQRNKGNVTEALKDYTSVIRLKPDNCWTAHRNRGYLLSDLGENKAALTEFNEDVRIDPTEPRSYMARGDCHLKLGDRNAATQDFMRAADLFRKQNMPEKAKEAVARLFQP
jgi:tetratricopeptide (TPR) repeat protein